MTKYIDRDLKRVNFRAILNDTQIWIECYLHEEELADKRYAVVERININSRGGANDFKLITTDDLAEAEIAYAAAEARVRAAIRNVLP